MRQAQQQVKKINGKDNKIVIGADIGGTHITAALVHAFTNVNDNQPRLLIQHSPTRLAVPSNTVTDELIDAWVRCIATAEQGVDSSKICIAMPGPFDYEEGVCLIRDQSKYPGLYGVNVKQRLATGLNKSPDDIYLHNDAACFLHGEVICGSAQGYNKVLGVTLGTGLGTAVFNAGAARSADLWNLEFRDSIAEEYISSRWFLRQYYEATGKEANGVKELKQMAETDLMVRNLFSLFGSNLGIFLEKFLDREPAEAIVIGGNISKAFSLFSAAMSFELQRKSRQVKILTSENGEDAALLGAVSSWYIKGEYSGGD